jgi:hypothetical protein
MVKIAAESQSIEITRWRFTSAKKLLTLDEREKSIDQRMPLKSDHRLLFTFHRNQG